MYLPGKRYYMDKRGTGMCLKKVTTHKNILQISEKLYANLDYICRLLWWNQAILNQYRDKWRPFSRWDIQHACYCYFITIRLIVVRNQVLLVFKNNNNLKTQRDKLIIIPIFYGMTYIRILMVTNLLYSVL